MNTFLKTGDRQPGCDCISSIVQVGDFFYFSGQLGNGYTFHDQCINALYCVKDVLHEFNLRFDHVLKFTVFLVDIQMEKEFLNIFSNFVEAPFPSMTIVEVSALPGQSMVCIEGAGINTLRHERSMEDAYCEDCDE